MLERIVWNIQIIISWVPNKGVWLNIWSDFDDKIFFEWLKIRAWITNSCKYWIGGGTFKTFQSKLAKKKLGCIPKDDLLLGHLVILSVVEAT